MNDICIRVSVRHMNECGVYDIHSDLRQRGIAVVDSYYMSNCHCIFLKVRVTQDSHWPTYFNVIDNCDDIIPKK